MENNYTIKESLIYSTLYVQAVPQNIYQHKSFSSFWSPGFEVNPEWTPTLNPKIVNEYDLEIPQSQTADNPVAPWGRAAQPSRDTRKTN